MIRGKYSQPVIPALFSFLSLLLFVWGVGFKPFFPAASAFQDIQWNFTLFFPIWGARLLSFLWIFPIGLGFLGWGRILRDRFFQTFEADSAKFLGLALCLPAFSFYVLVLAVNRIFYWPLTAMFFLPVVWDGWKELREFKLSEKWVSGNKWFWLVAFPLLLWAFELLSPPLVWDAILDHFRYAREISRLHQIPLHWVNHTGDMPKAAELVLAGLWNLGGEPLSKLGLVLPAVLTAWLLKIFMGGKNWITGWIFWSCPYFFAIYAFGYVEGFLAFFELAAFFCLWKGLNDLKKSRWFVLCAFFLGFSLTIKYTALLAIGAVLLTLVYEMGFKRKRTELSFASLLAIVVPFLPWAIKNILAFGNPIYPLATFLFGATVGYSPQMEQSLLTDTGVPWAAGLTQVPLTIWRAFFTAENAVGAPWTPLLAMSLPWFGSVFKTKLGKFLFLVGSIFLLEWLLMSSSFRHASGGTLLLLLLSSVGWQMVFRKKTAWAKPLFVSGLLISLWLGFTTQFSTTLPYASALGLEDPLVPLKQNFSFSMNTYEAYRYIEDHSDPRDKVMAFAVFQTYSLNRTAFVDFKWKRPIFYEWLSHCGTAEQAAETLREEGVRYFLYQKKEAELMSKAEKDFRLEGISSSEYSRFWSQFMEPVLQLENISVYRVRWNPAH